MYSAVMLFLGPSFEIVSFCFFLIWCYYFRGKLRKATVGLLKLRYFNQKQRFDLGIPH